MSGSSLIALLSDPLRAPALTLEVGAWPSNARGRSSPVGRDEGWEVADRLLRLWVDIVIQAGAVELK